MKLKCMMICALLAASTIIYSQKLKKPDKPTLQDFTIYSLGFPSILSYNGLITFPYFEDSNTAGAKDQYFSVKIESLVRIAVNKGDSIKKITGLSKTFEQGIRFKSIKYYYKNGNSISTRKIDEKDLLLTSDNIAYYIDCSKIIKDSAAIIDFKFYSESNSKSKIKLYLDNIRVLKDFNLNVFIPEIYFYDFISDTCIKTQIKDDFPGPVIGYRSPIRHSGNLLSKVVAESLSRSLNTQYEKVFCKTKRVSFNLVNPCTDLTEKRNIEIINLNLKKIIEIL